MKYFEKYVSNTLAGSAVQSWFSPEDSEKEYTGRAFFKVFCGGKLNYSFLFSNMTDGSYKYKSNNGPNDPCGEWEIVEMGAAVVKPDGDTTGKECFINADIPEMLQVTFGGCDGKKVKPGEFFTTDEIELDADKDDFVCLEITFKGKKIANVDQNLIPTYIHDGEKWVYDMNMPLPTMLGCERSVKTKIGFLGDSITNGLGTTFNGYAHWVAKIGEAIGVDYSVWNLGIGCAKGEDAATDGSWLFKAKQCDFVNVCLGVNDIFISDEPNADEIKGYITNVVGLLRKAGVRVGIMTPFPFGWADKKLEAWNEICRYIREELSKECEYCFVTSDYVGYPDKPQTPKYSGHPNDEGCSVLADGFMRFISEKGFKF